MIEKIWDYKIGIIEMEIYKADDPEAKLHSILEFLEHDTSTLDDIAKDAIILEENLCDI